MHDDVKIVLGILITINAVCSYWHPFGLKWPESYDLICFCLAMYGILWLFFRYVVLWAVYTYYETYVIDEIFFVWNTVKGEQL